MATTSPRILVVLQSAYAKGELVNGYHYRRWQREFMTSRTATRLSVLLGEYFPSVRYTNCTPVVTATIDEVPQADAGHLQRVLRRCRPAVVVGCGRVAESVLPRLWSGSLVLVPHPSFRLLTNQLLLAGNQLLQHCLAQPGVCRFRLKQGISLVHKEKIA